MKNLFKLLFVMTLSSSPLLAVYPQFPNIPPDGPQPMSAPAVAAPKGDNPLVVEEKGELEESYRGSFASLRSWRRYRIDFGIEAIRLRFPTQARINQGETLLTAFAHDRNVCYSFYGYYPPIGSLNAQTWFDEALACADTYPFCLQSYTKFVDAHGYWVLDYVTHDTHNDMVLKTRSVVTPFNAYTLQASHPFGCYDQFDYFLTSFRIDCGCSY